MSYLELIFIYFLKFLSFHIWRIYLLDIVFNCDEFFSFWYFKNSVPSFPGLHCFWWEIGCNSFLSVILSLFLCYCKDFSLHHCFNTFDYNMPCTFACVYFLVARWVSWIYTLIFFTVFDPWINPSWDPSLISLDCVYYPREQWSSACFCFSRLSF